MSYHATIQTESLISASDWMKNLRQKAYDRFQALGFPTRKMEDWKYIDLAPILGASFVPPETKGMEASELKEFEKFFFCRLEQNRIALVNGVFTKELSSELCLPEGVILENLGSALSSKRPLIEPYLGANLEKESNAFNLINTFRFRDGVFLYVPEGVTVEAPVHILLATAPNAGQATAFDPRILLVVGKNANVKIVVDHAAAGSQDFFSNVVLEGYLDSGASVEYSQIQRHGKEGFQFVSSHFYLKDKSRLRAMLFARGGRLTRTQTCVDFGGEGASMSLKGLSVLSGESEVYCHALVHHRAGRCQSRQVYKNILAEKSKSEFNSFVAVEKNANGSDSQQLNKNLLLSDQARAYSRPQLKIDADDVACAHGAAVGQLREDELFYLKSRGFSEGLARYVLTHGFAEEILSEVEPEGLRLELERWTSEEIRRVMTMD